MAKNHTHKECSHSVEYCKTCDSVYCKECGREVSFAGYKNAFDVWKPYSNGWGSGASMNNGLSQGIPLPKPNLSELKGAIGGACHS